MNRGGHLSFSDHLLEAARSLWEAQVGHPFVQGIGDIFAPWIDELDQGKGQLYAYALFDTGLSDHFRVEIHVGKSSGAGAQHLGDGKLGAETHVVGVHQARFHRPDSIV